jgi:hypothetical protein
VNINFTRRVNVVYVAVLKTMSLKVYGTGSIEVLWKVKQEQGEDESSGEWRVGE